MQYTIRKDNKKNKGPLPLLNEYITGVAGFEPTHEGVQSPLPYRLAIPQRKVEESGFEPLNQKERIYSPPRLATSLLLHMIIGKT